MGFLCGLVILAGAACCQTVPEKDGASRFQKADRPREFSFPADHGNHPAHRIEWWYLTGHLVGESGAEFGFQFTVFRVGLEGALGSRPSRLAATDIWFGHVAVTDVNGGRCLMDERASRGWMGDATAAEGRLSVKLGDWMLEEISADLWRVRGVASSESPFEFDLELRATKAPVLHGKVPGWSRKGPLAHQSSYYASITRMAARGRLRLGNTDHEVIGSAWFDHEFGSDQIAPGVVGWDWFAVQADDGTDLMLYGLRQEDGTSSTHSSGTIIDAKGNSTHLESKDFEIKVLETWTSPKSKARYPSKWRISVPSHQLTFEMAPKVTDQELQTERSTRVTYFEGAASGAGHLGDRPVRLQAYVELTGYAGAIPKF